jgi:hypothetical protein
MKLKLTDFVVMCCVISSAVAASAQTSGKRTPEQMQASYGAHKGDFDYLLGDWEFTAVSREYGNFRGYWSAVRLDEGQILDEYRVVGDKGETYYGGKTWETKHQTLEARRIGPGRSLGPLASARKAATASDSITGHWGDDNATFLELRFDGTSGVTGTAIWRGGSRPEIRTAIKSGTFDPKTGALRLEGEGPGRDGVMAQYVIEGKLENDAITGNFAFGNAKGGFRFTRR